MIAIYALIAPTANPWGTAYVHALRKMEWVRKDQVQGRVDALKADPDCKMITARKLGGYFVEWHRQAGKWERTVEKRRRR